MRTRWTDESCGSNAATPAGSSKNPIGQTGDVREPSTDGGPGAVDANGQPEREPVLGLEPALVDQRHDALLILLPERVPLPLEDVPSRGGVRPGIDAQRMDVPSVSAAEREEDLRQVEHRLLPEPEATNGRGVTRLAGHRHRAERVGVGAPEPAVVQADDGRVRQQLVAHFGTREALSIETHLELGSAGIVGVLQDLLDDRQDVPAALFDDIGLFEEPFDVRDDGVGSDQEVRQEGSILTTRGYGPGCSGERVRRVVPRDTCRAWTLRAWAPLVTPFDESAAG